MILDTHLHPLEYALKPQLTLLTTSSPLLHELCYYKPKKRKINSAETRGKNFWMFNLW